MRRWIQNSPVAVGVVLVFIGLVMLYWTWHRAASKDFIEGQFPYLISGGIGALIVVGAGLTVILVQARRRDNAELVQRLDELTALLRESGLQAPSGPMAVPDGADVVAGRSTYHDPGCRVVEGRGDFRPMSLEAATELGLAPCRICLRDNAVSA